MFLSKETYDSWMTPKVLWENIAHLIPKDAVLWEAFAGNGQSAQFLRELGWEVICKDEDFFETSYPNTICVSNIPFSKSKEILQRLRTLDIPFILIMPQGKISTLYFREIFSDDDDIQIIIPKKRVNFRKMRHDPETGWSDVEGEHNKINFEVYYYCYKINLKKDIIFLREKMLKDT